MYEFKKKTLKKVYYTFYFRSFLNENWPILIALSVFNGLSSILLFGSPIIFLVKEIFIFIFIFIKWKYYVDIENFTKNIEVVDSVLFNKYPVLKWENRCFYTAMLLIYILILCDIQNGYTYLLFMVGYSLFFIAWVLMLYRLVCIASTPEVATHFNLVGSTRLNGVRSFGTFNKAAMICRTCISVAGKTVFVCVAAPKLLNFNLDVRGPMDNLISKTFLYGGITSESQRTWDLAFEIRQQDPSYDFTDSRGMADRNLCNKWFLERGLPLPPPKWSLSGTIVNHEVSLPKASDFWKK